MLGAQAILSVHPLPPQMETATPVLLSHIAHIHPLKQHHERIDPDTGCDGCRARLLTGPGTAPYFACQKCRFYLHTRCAIAPISKKFSSVHSSHQLRLGFQASQTGKHCDVCKVHNVKNYIVGLFYECRTCNFDAHIACVAPWRGNSSALCHFSHVHPLELLEGEIGGLTCAGCRCQVYAGSGMRPHFACKECGFYLHFRCAAAPFSKYLPSVHSNHELTLGFQAARERKFCDVCEGNKRIIGLFYECRACNFDAHLSCVQPWRVDGSDPSNEASSTSPIMNMSCEFENLRIDSRNSIELQQTRRSPPSNATTPLPKNHSRFPEVADAILDVIHQVAQSTTEPDEYQNLLQHFKDTFPKADGNTISAIAMHLQFPSNQKVYKSMMDNLSTLRSYVRRVLDPRSAPPINMSFLFTSSPTEAHIVTGRPV